MNNFDGAPAPNNAMPMDEVEAIASAFDPTQRITAIPTRYKGYTCRSRTEARWCVFWDAMQIRFEFEPEGLQMENGERYLPDFYLPDFKWFCEVKPTEGILNFEDKARRFALAAGIDILFLVGPPDFRSYRGISGGFDDGMEYSLDTKMWTKATREGRLYAAPSYDLGDVFSDDYQTAIWASRGERFGV